MKMEKGLQKAFNDQVNNELYAGYLYLSMAAWFEEVALPGFAHWMKVQAREELGHAMKIFGFLNDRGARVTLKAIAAPPAEFKSARDAFDQALAHEQMVTGKIDELYRLSGKAGDTAASVFLHWFIDEQVEEEKNASDILAMLGMVKQDSGQILMIDRKLAAREG